MREDQPLLAVQAEQHAHRAADLGFFHQQRHFDGHGVRIGQVSVGRTIDRGPVVGERRRLSLCPPALHVEDVVGGDAIEPSAKRALALERAELGDDLDQHLLGHLLGVLRPEDHADGDVVDPRLVPQDQLLQRGAVAVLGPFHQFGICRATIVVLGEGIEHASSPCPSGTDIVGAGAGPGHLDTVGE